MTVRVYADAAAYAAYFPGSTAPANLDVLLRQASRVVDKLLRGRVYDVDPTSLLPTDADVAAAMSDATCAIAGELDALGTLNAGGTQQWESVAIGSVQLSNLQGASASDPLLVDGVPVPPAAILALGDVGQFRYSVGAPPVARPLDRVVT